MQWGRGGNALSADEGEAAAPRQGLTQQSFAETAGLEYHYFQKIESSRWRSLRLDAVEKLAKALSVAVRELFVPARTEPSAVSRLSRKH